MSNRVFLGMYNECPIYYSNELRSGIACTTDEDGKIYDYLVIVKDLKQAIQAIRLYGQFSFKIRL
jgi:hypothetical protein